LGTVVAALEEGRRIYANVRRFLVYGLSGGAAEILVMLAGPFLGLALPLLAAQILWINLVTHGLTGVALGAEPVEPNEMTRPPRPPQQSILGDGLWQQALGLGAFVAAITLGVATLARATDREWQSLLFLTLTSLQLGIAVGLRARPKSSANPWLLVAATTSLVLVLAGVYIPALLDVLGTTAVSRRGCGCCRGFRSRQLGNGDRPATTPRCRSAELSRNR
jgi:Ca2+-transporting ATPase